MSHGISKLQKLILEVISETVNQQETKNGKVSLQYVVKATASRYGHRGALSHSYRNSFYRALRSLEDRKLIERDKSKGKRNQLIWRPKRESYLTNRSTIEVREQDDYYLPG